MSSLARIALGTVQPSARPEPMAWALLDLFSRQGLQTQHFLSQACFSPHSAAATITGQCSRHLDSWVMSQEICREVFVRGTATADIGLIEGRYLPPSETARGGGRLGQLCDWLDVARIVVVDVEETAMCKLPPRPRRVDGVLLELPAGSCETARVATHFEALWGAPVLGCLEWTAALRQQLKRLSGQSPPRQFCQELGDQLASSLNLKRLLKLAGDRPPLACASQLFTAGEMEQPVCVAIAYDEAFHCYFPDLLDLLELRGALVCDFSPLRGESLPPETDIVYFGCGHPERFASELADNHCMLAALRNHVCAGKRLYAEGGGLAYLCREIETLDGRRLPMVGAFPAMARMNGAPVVPQPYEARLATDNWLGQAGAVWRGYINSAWTLEAAPELIPCLSDLDHRGELVARHHALGSRLHINFVAHPAAVESFLRSHAASLQWPFRSPELP